MRAKAAGKNCVAVVKQVMGSDRRRDVGPASGNEIGCIAGRDVLEYHLERRVTHQQGLQHALDEHLLAVEHVDRRIGRLAMHQQGHPQLGHRRHGRIAAFEIGHAGVGVGRCARPDRA
jgi:hypothetical protein